MTKWSLLFALVLLAFAPAAQATFPGRNGGIAFDQQTSSGDAAPQVENTRLAVRPPGSAAARILLDCELTDGVPSGGDCTGTDYAAALVLRRRAADRLRRGHADRHHRRHRRPGDPPSGRQHRRRQPRVRARRRAHRVHGDQRAGRKRCLRPLPGRRRRAVDHQRRHRTGMVVAQRARLRAQRERLRRPDRRDEPPFRHVGGRSGLVAEREAAAARASLAEERLRRPVRERVRVQRRRARAAPGADHRDRRLPPGLVPGRALSRLRPRRPGRVRPAAGQHHRPPGGAQPVRQRGRLRGLGQSGLAAAAP